MIIRTEESRTMGAKFLDHADLGSREECLHLCCETDNCDVFVFEEKVSDYRMGDRSWHLTNEIETKIKLMNR